ncbi:carotenoid oxygenase [Neolentinus lepideus HHB14362 ss-1]|uniref:Carotenoid oxygenase n=1 Tax=Neolentinus lepideus HHB14362 ss-1 TaxID=1314782 RepID=A0A165S426_9AGAM|nr:carotenoid oxygenase [Neolentinus lepideus HHB14362 ss-1]
MAQGIAIGYENAIEQREPVKLQVTGTIPSWLTGRLYRTRPGTWNIPSNNAPSGSISLKHWFDGLGMTHCFEITSTGEVKYRNHSTALGLQARFEKAGKAVGAMFGQQDPCETIFSKFFTAFKEASSDRTSVDQSGPDDLNLSVTLTPDMPGFTSHHAIPSGISSAGPRYIVAKSDYRALQLLDPDTLRPLHSTTYEHLDPRLDGSVCAAHSCRDKETGEFYNYTLKFGSTAVYKVFRIRPLSQAESSKDYEVDILAEIKDAPAAYLHALTMTEKYVVLSAWQADFTFVAASIGAWKPKQSSTFYVIDRHAGGIVAKFETQPFFAFHYINAYDSGDDIVIDIAVYDDHSILQLLYVDILKSGTPTPLARARRFILKDIREQSSGKSTWQAKVEYTLSPSLSIELCTVHPALYHKPYRYTYGINKEDFTKSVGFADRIVKLDMAAPESEPKIWAIPGTAPGEPIFVPRPGSSPETQEDDGILLSVVLDGKTQKSMLVMLDAKDLTEVARAEIGTHFPFGFHGVFTAPR